MTRDLVELASYSITNIVIENFEDLINDFQDLPNDEILRADLSYAVEQRDAKKNTVLNIMRSISFRAKAVFGENTSKYRAMTPGNISQMPESNLLIAANQVHFAATESLAELASEGVTAQYLADFKTAIEAYETAINNVNIKKVARDTGSETKILKGNELYALVVKYCDYGKLIWDGVSPAKYNDYIIYTSTSPGTLTAPQNFMFDPVNYDFSWEPVNNATSYILQESTDGTNWTQYWSGAETTCAYEESPAIMMFFRVIPNNSGGHGPASLVTQYDFAPVLVAPSNLNYNYNTSYFTWNAVPNAEYYEFQYRAQTNPTWNSLNAGNVTSFYHADPPGEYLARLRAVSGTTMGPWSAEEEYSVGSGD